jgi:hypothetical protein
MNSCGLAWPAQWGARVPDLGYWRRLPAGRRWLLLEAWATMHAARLALRVVPYKRLTWLFEQRAREPQLSGLRRAEAKRQVRWAVIAAGRRQRESLVCFPRAIAAQAMLRRRGVSTTLYYGAKRTSERGLTTHVWIQDGDDGIVGLLSRPGQKVLARYPER